MRSGLECAQALAPGASRSSFELSLQLALGGPLIATRGFASSEAEAAYLRAEELSRELQSEADLFAALRGLGYVYHVRANLRGATGLVEEVVALAKRSADPELLAEADHFAGMLSFHLGQFQSSHDRLEKLAEGGEYRGGYHSEVYGIDTRVLCRGYISHCEWHLGYPIRGLKIAEEGLALAREISHPFSIAMALDYLAMLRHQFRRDVDAALKAAVEGRNICAEYRFDYYGAWSKLIRAWAIAESGNLDEGLADYDAALEEFRRTSAGLRISHHLGLLAALHGKAGRASTGLRLIDEAIAIAKTNSECWHNAELHRERGDLLLLASGHDAETQADKEFQAAIEIAAAQGAKLPELRASVARARLLVARGEGRQARDTLTAIYGWFSEGLEARDFVEARSPDRRNCSERTGDRQPWRGSHWLFLNIGFGWIGATMALASVVKNPNNSWLGLLDGACIWRLTHRVPGSNHGGGAVEGDRPIWNGPTCDKSAEHCEANRRARCGPCRQRKYTPRRQCPSVTNAAKSVYRSHSAPFRSNSG